uniref:Calcineurin B-like protein 10 n=1 Tax=Rhizophora mucronata TaxID=61149 RepID=A0A2P2KG69_RHIMU
MMDSYTRKSSSWHSCKLRVGKTCFSTGSLISLMRRKTELLSLRNLSMVSVFFILVSL